MSKPDHTIEFDRVCVSCNSTGLYIGMAERNGAAIVCSTCKGTGKCHVKIEWNDFTGRQHREGVSRVYATNPGICLGSDHGHTLESFGGLSYEEWEGKKEFLQGSENRKSTCPAWWYQCANYKKKPKWEDCIGAGSFSGCTHFPDKLKCWQRWVEENPNG